MSELTASTKPPGLLRVLGPWTAIAIVVGTVIGSGIFKKPSTVAEHVHATGPAAIVWIVGGVLGLCGSLSLAEVAVLFPRAGGMYVFVREGYGRCAAFLFGWIDFWLMRTASMAALSTVFVEALHDLLRALHGMAPQIRVLGFWTERWMTVVVIMALSLVNIRGVRWGGLLQLVITSVKVGSLLLIALLPFIVWGFDPSGDAERPSVENLTPLWPAAGQLSLAGFGSALLAVLWAYDGWYNVTPVAAEIRRPERNLPLALIGGSLLVIVLYLSANLGYCLIIPQDEMTLLSETSVVAEFSRRLLGPIGMAVAAGVVLCSTFGAVNGNILIGPRVFFAMGEDGLAPRALQLVHSRYRTPVVAILAVAIWSSLLVLATAALQEFEILKADKSVFNILSELAVFGTTVFITLAVASIFVFRRRLPDALRPYRCWGYPVTPIVAIAIMLGVAGNMLFEQTAEAATGLGFIALGAAVYWLVYQNSAPSSPAAAEQPGC